MANSIISKTPNITVERVTKSFTIAGNTDTQLSFASVLSGTPKVLIPEGYTAGTSWATKLITKEVDPATMTVQVRTDGGTQQTYWYHVTALYW